MMDDFPEVTVEALRARWPDMPPGSEEHARVLLEDAGVLIRAAAPGWFNLPAEAITIVACRMVKRAMAAGAFVEGASSLTQTAGPFNQQVSFANPNGDLYLSRAEKKLLGIGSQRATTIDLFPAPGCGMGGEGHGVAQTPVHSFTLGLD